MKAAAQQLMANDKALIALPLILGATVLAALGKMSIEAWENYSEWIFGIFAGSTALHGGLAALAGKASK